ncbi:hypothetical protein GbCGDNIH6_8311 [Granulibacter bethesdensis]|nr:hypothetical protein GbCGDNIH6_8311 [Granulibacter bethesdensis]
MDMKITYRCEGERFTQSWPSGSSVEGGNSPVPASVEDHDSVGGHRKAVGTAPDHGGIPRMM